MKYSTCKTCGANNGRAGTLTDDECRNCHDTRRDGIYVLHSYLVRTPEEIELTFAIMDDHT